MLDICMEMWYYIHINEWRTTYMLDITVYTQDLVASYYDLSRSAYARLTQAIRLMGPFEKTDITYQFDGATTVIEVLCIDEKLRFILAVTLIDQLSKPQLDELAQFIYLEI